MTTQTTTHAARTIAGTLADMLGRAEELARAHDALALPDGDDTAVDWRAVIAQIDALGEASHQLTLLARDTMIPTLKALKAHAQTALAEVETLDRLAQASPTA